MFAKTKTSVFLGHVKGIDKRIEQNVHRIKEESEWNQEELEEDETDHSLCA